MGRPQRVDVGGVVYHVLNRSNGRAQIFKKDSDYQAFLDVVEETLVRVDISVLGFCIMPNHWHFLLQPHKDGCLAHFMRNMTNTHVKRYQSHYDLVGTGHLYQGRYKSFPIEETEHLYTVLRYVERNAKRANLVDRAENWKWGSAYHRLSKPSSFLSSLPVELPDTYFDDLNIPFTATEEELMGRLREREVS